MRKRFLSGVGVVLLAVLVALVVWEGSFTFGEYAPTTPGQTYLFWAVSTLIFLLMVTVGFMLFRTGVKLYFERQRNREGSRIKTKLVIGALALSVIPVFFLVLWSIHILNFNLQKWFGRPAENIRLNLRDVSDALERESWRKAEAQAAWLAALSETRRYLETGIRSESFFQRLCEQNGIQEAHIERGGGTRMSLCSVPAASARTYLVRTRVAYTGRGQAELVLRSEMPPDLAVKQREIAGYIQDYDQLARNRKSARATYLLLLGLITLFILFVATWIALFMARQISVPITALLEAADRVRKGDLGYRVHVRAIDELASLVRAFNEMTRGLEMNARELESRRRFIEAILESIPTGVISVSSDGRIQTVNHALSRIFPPEEVERAKRLEDLFSRDEAAEIRYLMNRARRTGAASRQLDFKTERQVLHLAVTVSALEERVTSGFVLILEDTSELLRAQKAAAWHEVARRIAHEMKNPLTPIALSADRIARQLERASLQEGAVPADFTRVLRECSSTISKEVQSVKTLVDEFSQFARFPAAQPVPTDLNRVVEEALAVFAGRLDGISVSKELAERLPPVHIDPEQFKRVIVNLVDNSAEAMQSALIKRLFVGTRAVAADFVELMVSDTGCGISAEDKEKLFLPYFSTKGRGTGLGLAIVNHILSEHGAAIRVEDNHPAGARFIIEVPALLATEAEWRPAENRA